MLALILLLFGQVLIRSPKVMSFRDPFTLWYCCVEECFALKLQFSSCPLWSQGLSIFTSLTIQRLIILALQLSFVQP